MKRILTFGILLSTVFCIGTFYCKTNNFKIPIEYVNDGIFDCDDGSDEFSTHLYNMGEFVCQTELGNDGKARRIHNMLVNDGICDCCDCSDESLEVSSSWQNQCMEENTKQLNELIRKYTTAKDGIAIAKKGPTKKEVIQEIKQSITRLSKDNKKILSIYQRQGGISQEQHKQYTMNQQTIQLFKGVLSLLSNKDKQSLLDLFGENWRYLPLLTECFTSEPFGEQEMKRGTANYYNKIYTVEFCPFRGILQYSNQTETWRKRNDFVKFGGSKKDAAAIDLPNDESWEYTVIGLQNAWLEEVTIPDHLKMYLQRPLQSTQFYQGDDVCINGDHRTTVVLMECGTANQVVQFREYGMCNYELQFVTPYACTVKQVEELKHLIDEVTHNNEFGIQDSEFTVQLNSFVYL